MSTVADLFAQAVYLHRSGQPSSAKQCVRTILSAVPGHGGAWHLLGVIAYQSGRMAEAAECFQQAVAAEPGNAAFHSTLGAAYQALGRFAEAAACHEEALRLRPGDGMAANNYGVTLMSLGRTADACTAFRQALAGNPNDAELLSNLAAALRIAGQLDEAVPCFRRALDLRPDLPEAHNNLGNVLRTQGRLDEAANCYRRAVDLRPTFAQAWSNLGRTLHEQSRLDDALHAAAQAVRLRPDFGEAHENLGLALLERHRVDEALHHLHEAARLMPGHAPVHNNLGNAWQAKGRLNEAVACYRRARELRPDFAEAVYNLGVALQSRGQLMEARACFERALELKPYDAVTHSTFLGSLIYDPDVDGDKLLAEHLCWAERHASRFVAVPHANRPDPRRRLRVGYVSPDFRWHAVAYFLIPILRHHDREQVEVFCYADVAAPDGGTAFLRKLADHWRDTYGLADERWAEQVRADEIDILVDLAGHTAGHRLLAFARKPAPVQVSYLGYPATTGLAAMDYRLADAVTDPPGEPASASEELVRLDPVFCCYAPPANAPVVSPLPAGPTGPVTFGSLHKLEKLNDAVLDLWAEIVRNVPGSRLLLCRNTLRGETAAHLVEWFARRGVVESQLLLREVEPVDLRHLAVYHEIDIALDPFPWNGHTTACEALWMGVPVVALRGQRHSARMVASVLTSAGLPELIAETPEEYVRLACELAVDRLRLSALREQLRPRVAASPVCDGARFTRRLEEAYRTMWQEFCQPRGVR